MSGERGNVAADPEVADGLGFSDPGALPRERDGDSEPPPNARCGFCDYKYQCLSPGASCHFAIKQAGMQSTASPAPQEMQQDASGVWVRYFTQVSGPAAGDHIVAFYRDEIDALRDAVGQGHRVKQLAWGSEL